MRRDRRSSPSSYSVSASSASPRVADQVGRGRAGAVHPHVERAVAAEREAARRVVDLEGGQAEIHHHAVQPLHAVVGQQREHVRRRSRAAGAAGRGTARRQRGAAGDGVRVAVDRPQACNRRRPGWPTHSRRRRTWRRDRWRRPAGTRARPSTSASMTGMWPGHAVPAAPGRLSPRRRGAAAGLVRPALLGGGRVPDLEDVGRAHERRPAPLTARRARPGPSSEQAMRPSLSASTG